MVATGKGSKRSGKTIALEDSDDDEKQQQSAPKNIANKRRRTILEDDDDDDDDSDEVKIVSPNRLVKRIYLSHKHSTFPRFALDPNIVYQYIIIKTTCTFDIILITILTSLLYSSSLLSCLQSTRHCN